MLASMNYYKMMLRRARGVILWWALRRASAFILLVTLFLFPASAWAYTTPPATSGPTLQVSTGFNTHYPGWVPVYITLSNNGADFSGTLSISVSTPILPPGRRLILPSGYQEPIDLLKGTQRLV